MGGGGGGGGVRMPLVPLTSYAPGFRSLVARLAPLKRFGTKRANFFGNGKSVWTDFRISAPQWWPFKKGETGSVKGETNSAIFWQGKCKLIANFSATMVTSLPSFSLSLNVEEREENLDVEEKENERKRGSNLRRQRLASPTAQVLVAQTTQPVQKNRPRDEL